MHSSADFSHQYDYQTNDGQHSQQVQNQPRVQPGAVRLAGAQRQKIKGKHDQERGQSPSPPKTTAAVRNPRMI